MGSVVKTWVHITLRHLHTAVHRGQWHPRSWVSSLRITELTFCFRNCFQMVLPAPCVLLYSDHPLVPSLYPCISYPYADVIKTPCPKATYGRKSSFYLIVEMLQTTMHMRPNYNTVFLTRDSQQARTSKGLLVQKLRVAVILKTKANTDRSSTDLR